MCIGGVNGNMNISKIQVNRPNKVDKQEMKSRETFAEVLRKELHKDGVCKGNETKTENV